MKRYHTKSGSIYEVDGTKVRRTQGGDHYKGRASGAEWAQAENVMLHGGHLVIDWGEQHAGRGQYTETSKVVLIEDV